MSEEKTCDTCKYGNGRSSGWGSKCKTCGGGYPKNWEPKSGKEQRKPEEVEE